MRALAFAAAATFALSVLSGCSGSNVHSGLYGHAMLGPTCPVQRDPPDPSCSDKPYVGTLVALNASDPRVPVATFQTGPDGAYNVTLAPGLYRLETPAGQNLPRCGAPTTMVTADHYTLLDVQCDSGIRSPQGPT